MADPPVQPNHNPQEAAARREAFSQRLKAFLQSDYYLDQVNVTPVDDNPTTYILAQLFILETATHPHVVNIAQTIGSISEVVSSAVTVASLDNSPLGVVYKMAASLAPAAHEWAKQQRREFDRDQVHRQLDEPLRQQEINKRHADALCAQISLDIQTNDAWDNEACERAIRTLQILLQATSISVSQTIRTVPRMRKAKTAGWSAGAAVGLAAVSVCLFAPVIPVAATGFAFYGPLVACLAGTGASATATGVSIKNAVVNGKEWTRSVNAVTEIQYSFAQINNNIKALVGFLGYLWQTQPSLQWANSAAYIALLARLDASLSGDRAVWTDPRYIKKYIDEASIKLDADMGGLSHYMGSIGVSIDPLTV